MTSFGSTFRVHHNSVSKIQGIDNGLRNVYNKDMVKQLHCPECGFLMMPMGDSYVCPDEYGKTVNKANQDTDSDNKWFDLGPNLDLILRGYQKKSPSSPIEE